MVLACLENFHGWWIFYIFTGYSWVMICCNPLKTNELWHHEIFGHEIHGFLSTFEKAMKCHFHRYFMASGSLYSIFHGSWIWKFSQVFHGIIQVFFMALRPWKCHWFNHGNPVKNLWIYNELFHKFFMGFDFIVRTYLNPALTNDKWKLILVVAENTKWKKCGMLSAGLYYGRLTGSLSTKPWSI